MSSRYFHHDYLAKIWRVLTRYERRKAPALLGLMVIGMLLETLGVGLVIPAVTLMVQGDIFTGCRVDLAVCNYFHQFSHADLIRMAMVGLVGVYLIKNTFLAFLIWKQTYFSFDVQASLSQRLFTLYLRQPYTFHLQRNSAELIRNVTGEVGMFTVVLNSSLMLITESMVLIGITLLLMMVEPVGALIVGLGLGGVAWLFYGFTRERIFQWGVERQLHDGLRIQHLQQGLGGAKDVKLLGRESDFLSQFDLHNFKSARVQKLQSTLQNFPRLVLELLAVTGLAILVISMLGQGKDMATILPTMGLFAAAAFRLMPSVNRVLGALQTLRYSLPVINTLTNELSLTSPALIEEKSDASMGFSDALTLTDVTYRYAAASDSALDGISIRIKKGESVGFIGASGSGKSTLIDVILGLLTPDAGVVKIDGEDILPKVRQWQNHIGYVPQSIYLTDDSIRRNVAFGLPEDQIDDLAVERAIRAAQLETFVQGLPDGIETIVGERGVRLSGGQRQRIGIARALYHDPDVLVLDEATSALDVETENGVMESVAAFHGSKTIIVVAHRLTTVANCDRLYRLDRGRVVQEGPPEVILASDWSGSNSAS